MSALLPISRTVTPLTVIRPSAMTCSAPRREATPARARIFWRRSSFIDPPSYPPPRRGEGTLVRVRLRASLHYPLFSTPHPIPPHVGGGERSCTYGSAP